MSAEYIHVPESDRESRLLAEISGLQDELKIAAGKTEVKAYDGMLQELAEKDAEIQRLTEQLEDAQDAAVRAERELENQYAKELRSTGRCPFCGAQG
jgi:DNA repair exonuclease SbcCD ATPase subunit